MGKSKATPRPSVSEVMVMMITAATNCQREIWIRLAMYCRKGRLEGAARVLCPWGADSLRGTGMVQTIAEAGCAGDCQHGHGCGCHPRFPVQFRGFRAFHAPFLERRIRSRVRRTGNS